MIQFIINNGFIVPAIKLCRSFNYLLGSYLGKYNHCWSLWRGNFTYCYECYPFAMNIRESESLIMNTKKAKGKNLWKSKFFSSYFTTAPNGIETSMLDNLSNLADFFPIAYDYLFWQCKKYVRKARGYSGQNLA